jgi:hypothetical protein
MLDTYIKHKGIAKTIIHNNNQNNVNEVMWDADYDGNIANISLDIADNGENNHISFKLNNDDLASILNIPSMNNTNDKRLKRDFVNLDIDIQEPRIIQLDDVQFPKMDILSNADLLTHISSPLPNEELIIPLTIDKKTADNYTITPRKKHKRHKTHITHRVFRRPKSSKSKSRTTRTKTNRVKSLPIIELL